MRYHGNQMIADSYIRQLLKRLHNNIYIAMVTCLNYEIKLHKFT